MRQERGGIYWRTFTAAERRALRLEREAGAAPLEPEAELLRVLIVRELSRERSDDERVGRLVDRLVRIVRAQRVGAGGGGPESRLERLFGWLAEVGWQKREAALERGALAPPEAGR